MTADPELSGSVALVTGAGGGVGRGIALALAGAGAQVVLAVRRASTGEEVVQEIVERGGRALSVVADVADPAAVAAAVAVTLDRFGRLDHVVHNAASGRSSEVGSIDDLDASLLLEHSSVAVRALFHLAQLSFEPLRAASGSLVVLTSPAGIEGSGTLPFYAIVKSAQRGFVKALAREWGPAGIRVNAIAPLAVTAAMENAYIENPHLQARLEALTPLGWIGDPELDIGPPAVFLCSDAARYISGQTLAVSGGRFTAL